MQYAHGTTDTTICALYYNTVDIAALWAGGPVAMDIYATILYPGLFMYPACCCRSFFPGSQDRLASAAKDNQLIVWHLAEGEGETLTGQQALALQLPSSSGTAPHLAWHPTCSNILFMTAGNRVLAAHVSEIATAAQQVG